MIFNNVKTADLNELICSGKTTIILAYADFCGPCTMMKSEIKKLDNNDTNIVTIKIDDNQDYVIEKKIFGTPMIFINKNGKETERLEGFVPVQVLEGKLK